jgi:hypothetical protein
MNKNTDGSVTLTVQELDEVNKAYKALYGIIADSPCFLGDYFDEHEDYMNVVKWHCLLNGDEFDRDDWE